MHDDNEPPKMPLCAKSGHPDLSGFSSEVTLWCCVSATVSALAYFASVAAFSINAATSFAWERKIAWLPGSSMTCDWARFVMNRSRSGLIIRSWGESPRQWVRCSWQPVEFCLPDQTDSRRRLVGRPLHKQEL